MDIFYIWQGTFGCLFSCHSFQTHYWRQRTSFVYRPQTFMPSFPIQQKPEDPHATKTPFYHIWIRHWNALHLRSWKRSSGYTLQASQCTATWTPRFSKYCQGTDWRSRRTEMQGHSHISSTFCRFVNPLRNKFYLSPAICSSSPTRVSVYTPSQYGTSRYTWIYQFNCNKVFLA